MKRESSKWLVLFAATIMTATLFSSGCAWQLGGDKSGTTNIQATRGQELIDLKRARDQAAITEEEYQAQRNKILAK